MNRPAGIKSLKQVRLEQQNKLKDDAVIQKTKKIEKRKKELDKKLLPPANNQV
jgi:hypothetical protein